MLNSKGERVMAWIARIDDIQDIPGADMIVSYCIGGWRCVDKKGSYKIGDLVVYISIDSWVPHDIAPFLSKGKEPREYNGVKGERLRTVKLRGALSQGLLIPIPEDTIKGAGFLLKEGLDVTEHLCIQKWEAPIHAQLAGQVKGNFPSVIPKTDLERCQNLVTEIAVAAERGLLFEVTEKLEGSSMTVYRIRGEFGVCSRNLDLKRDDANTYWKVAIEDDIDAKMMSIDPYWDFAIQGELVGPNIQGNIYKLIKHEFYVYAVYNIQEGKYLLPDARRELVQRMGLKHVPVLVADKDVQCNDIQEILLWAEDKSRLNPKQEREGIAFKQVDGDMTFKAISNRYLLKS